MVFAFSLPASESEVHLFFAVRQSGCTTNYCNSDYADTNIQELQQSYHKAPHPENIYFPHSYKQKQNQKYDRYESTAPSLYDPFDYNRYR